MKKRRREPFSIEKNNDDFEQMRNSKLIKIDLFSEKCRVCKKVFTSETLANKHVKRSSCHKVKTKTKQPSKNVYCELCSESFTTRRKFKEHNYKNHTPKIYECTDCNKSFKRRYDWQRHKREKHEVDDTKVSKYNCDLCNFITTRKNSLNIHMQSIHSSDETPNANETETLRQVPQIHFSKIMRNGEEVVVFATENKLNFISTEQLIVKNESIITLPFSCDGIDGKGTKVLVYCSNECTIVNLSAENDTVNVIGFEGQVKEARWINSQLFYISTDIGIYIYNADKNVNVREKLVLWGEEEFCSCIVFETNTNNLFILNRNGEIRKTSYISNIDQEIYGNLNIFVKSGIKSMCFVEEEKIMVFTGPTGLWRYNDLTSSWSSLFNVGFLDIYRI